MKAMVLETTTDLAQNATPLRCTELPDPDPAPHELQIRVLVCGVCHTELDEIEGRTPPATFPIIPGHQVVGIVTGKGDQVDRYAIGNRVGVAWIFSACGRCHYCASGQENLCPDFRATGRDAHGGYAEYMTVPAEFAYPIPEVFSDAEAAPLLCAGAVGYRALRLCQLDDGQALGLTGFGASGHLVLQAALHKYPHSDIYVFARNPDERTFAEELGARWTGETEARAPVKLDAIIDTTPAWKPVVEALANLRPGGRLVINAIRKEAGDQDYLGNLDYGQHLWMEREIKSVANVTRADVKDLLALAAEIPLHPTVQEYALDQANVALQELRSGNIRGAKVLRISDGG
ncbi:MAG: zinc-dependent alcohol dehydrogenase family protein [Anaerolineae bacterium]|nr:zinc-dependent alcohol dehydrogenase family protein [Anaerolineae bacterium]